MLSAHIAARRSPLAWLAVALACATGSAVQADSPTHVGAAACARCHPEAARSWAGSHHDLAMQRADESSVAGDFDDASHTHNGVTTRFFRRDRRFMVHTEGPGGRMADFEVAYTFGFQPLQQYLIGFPDGRFQVLSLAWDDRAAERGGQRWYSIYPDETIPHDDFLHWTQPSQNWNHMCAECHSTDLRKGYRAASDSFETRWSEIDVSCEACHGPGSLHAARMTAAAAKPGKPDTQRASALAVEFPAVAAARWTIDATTRKPVRSPARSEHLEVETCARCHARRSQIGEGGALGRPIQDSHRVALLDPPLYYPDGQIRGEVYVYGSFIQSAMYAAGVTCSDCHDPHSGTLWAAGNALCSRCHPAGRFDVPQHHHHAPQTAASRCVACHMPSRVYMGIDERYDHSLRVPRPDLSEASGSPNACNGCHTSTTSQWAAARIETWFGEARRREPHWGSTLHAARSGARDGESRLMAMLAEPAIPGIARATAVSLLRRYASSRGPAALARASRDGDPLVRTAALAAAEGLPAPMRVALAAELLADPVRSVRFEAARILASVSASQLGPESSQRLHRVLAQVRDAEALHADRAESHMRLGEIALAQGRFDVAQQEYELARSREAGFIPAYVNLADLYRIREMDGESESVLRAALEIDSEQADVHHALGLTLVRMKRLADALGELEFAAENRPDNPRYAYVYAAALHANGKIARALAVLRRAASAHPGDRDLHSFLADLERKQRTH